MPAPKNNLFWLKRSKSGRDKIFKTPADLRKAGIDYINFAAGNPIYKIEQGRNTITRTEDDEGKVTTKSENNLIGIPIARPLTISGLRLFLGVSYAYLSVFKSDQRKIVVNDENKFTPAQVTEAEEFLNIIDELEMIIYTQKLEGAIAGLYSQNIVARELGLKENTDTTVSGNLHLTKEPIEFD